jgi:hypothetical protein
MNVRDNLTQDGNHSECVSLPMEFGSSKTRLDVHPIVGYIIPFRFQTLSNRPVLNPVLSDFDGFRFRLKREDTMSEWEYEYTKETQENETRTSKNTIGH